MVEQVSERCVPFPANWLVDGGDSGRGQVGAVAENTVAYPLLPKAMNPASNVHQAKPANCPAVAEYRE
ncbi:MAG: hypothetical protein JNL84_01465 [Candidatus Accumulibacter sp.]|nr:hypothetical protein [Accumulibacter sp.]